MQSNSSFSENAAEAASGRLKRDENYYYHKMIEEVVDYAIFLLNPDGFIQNWNRGAERIKGYSEQEIVGHHFRVFYTPEDQEARLPERLLGEARQQEKAAHEGWRVRKNGTRFWASVVITALHDEDGNILGFSKVTRDLTERKSRDDRLLQNARQLELQNRALQQFAYAAAHDMKEPLRKIQYYCSVILNGGQKLDPERQRSYLERSADAAGRMQLLIDDLLAWSKVADATESYQEVDCSAIVAETIDFYQETIDNTNAVIRVDALPTIHGILFQIRQLFLNLIGNALKYQEPGRRPEVLISADEEGPGISPERRFHHFRIKDNGIGFSGEEAEKIFGMFERLHSRETYAGTGIGLAICRKIMENHHGLILAQGTLGEGAVFDVYFPA